MQNVVKKMVTSGLGVLVVLAGWTLKDRLGCNDHASKTVKKIPSKVWEGGGATLTIEAESTEPASVVASFESHEVGDANHRFMEAWETIDPGKHTYTVDVPSNVGGSIAVLFPDPSVAKVGSTLRVRVLVNGQVLGEDSRTLEEALQPGYGMQVEVLSDDFANMKPSTED